MRSKLPMGLMAMAAAVPIMLAAHSSSVRAQPVASITLPDPGGTEQLYAGCNNISLTFPDGTASESVVQAVDPAGAVQAMWRHNAAENRFVGFSPAAPQASDLLAVDFLDAVWLCVAGAPPEAVPPPPARPDGALQMYPPTLPASAQNPVFSPDGRSILFTVFHRGYNAGPAGLYRLSLDGGPPVALLDEAGQDSVNLPGSSWNAATGRIAFASDRQDTDEVWTMAADGGSLFRVTHHRSPAYFLEPSFSPDGQWIVFEVDADAPEEAQQGSIWKVRTDGSSLTRLTNGPGSGTDDRQPNWSPFGDRILFQRRVAGSENWNLYTMTPNGTSVRQVTTSPSSDTDASWSPDGRWIVYSSDYGGLPVPNIFIVSAAGGTPIRLTYDDTHEDGAPSWSPDGKWIAFESHVGEDEESPAGLWRIAAPDLSASLSS